MSTVYSWPVIINIPFMADEKVEGYVFYTDETRAWLRVSWMDIVQGGLLQEVSPRSFMSVKYVYLDRDVDLWKFLDVKCGSHTAAQEYLKTVKWVEHEKMSSIRTYAPYGLLTPEDAHGLKIRRAEVLAVKRWDSKMKKKILRAKRPEIDFWYEKYCISEEKS